MTLSGEPSLREITFKKWVPFRQKKINAKRILVCFSHSGGSALAYKKWNERVALDTEIWAIQIPGRENRSKEPLEYDLMSLVRKMGEELVPYFVSSSLPTVFFGHSLGGLIAFEFARELRRKGVPLPKRLIISCTHAPQFPDDSPAIYQYPDDLFLEEIRKYEGTPPAFFQYPELIMHYLPILRADFALSETYTHQVETPISSPITVYGAHGDSGLKPEGLQAWKEQTQGPFQLRMFQGNHFYLHQDSNSFFDTFARDCSI